MLKRQWGAESNEKLPHLFIPSKTATLFPEFAVKYLPLRRTATVVPAFAVKDLPLGNTLIFLSINVRAKSRANKQSSPSLSFSDRE